MRKKILNLLFLLPTTFFFWNCAPFSKPQLLTSPEKPAYPSHWKSYGAFYMVDELFIEATYMRGQFATPITKYIINKKLKILTTEGARYGTIRVPLYASFIKKFRIRLIDSNGTEIPIKTEPLRRQYLDGDKIVVPNVTAGCVIHINIEASKNSPLVSHEHYFSQDIPVAVGKFTFSSLDNYQYDYKEYGGLSKRTTEQSTHKRIQYSVWQKRNLTPRSRLNYQNDIDTNEPRVSLVMGSHTLNFGTQNVFQSWDDLAEKYQEQLLKRSFFSSSSKTKKQTDAVISQKETPFEKADAIFDWVQKNMSPEFSQNRKINPDKVLKKRKGNVWELAVLLNAMFNHAGFSTDILVTRPRQSGGFDPAFVTPIVLAIPLIVVRVDTANYLVYPFSKGAFLGEYPTGYYGLHGLSLNDAKPRKLPQSPSGPPASSSEVRLELSGDNLDKLRYRAEIQYSGALAYVMRNRLLDREEKKVKEGFQEFLKDLGPSNRLIEFKINHMEDRGKPITVALEFENANQSVSRENMTQINLSNLFNTHFESYDTSRVSQMETSLAIEFNEALQVTNGTSRSLNIEFSCEEIDNQLFSAACSRENLGESTVLKRSYKLKKASVSPNVMRVLMKDIHALNRINESKLILN